MESATDCKEGSANYGVTDDAVWCDMESATDCKEGSANYGMTDCIQQDDTPICDICFEGGRDLEPYPCGISQHKFCATCTKQLPKCPLCGYVIPIKLSIYDECIVACSKGDLQTLETYMPQIVTATDINNICYKGVEYACENGHLDIIKYLVLRGANVHFINHHYGYDYGFRAACCFGYLEVVKYFISQGINPQTQNNYGVRHACAKGHLEVVQYLVTQGADIHSQNEEGVINACANGHLEVVQYLVAQGANVHVRNNRACMLACVGDRLPIVQYLVEHCNIRIYNKWDYLYKEAKEADSTSVVEYFDSIMLIRMCKSRK